VSYIDENLLPDEHVVYRAALHWIIFARAILVLVGGLVLVFVPGAAPVGLVVLLVGAVMLVPPFVAYRTTELGVTNKRVIVKTGLVQRRTLELLLRQVEAISIDQEPAGPRVRIRVDHAHRHRRRARGLPPGRRSAGAPAAHPRPGGVARGPATAAGR